MPKKILKNYHSLLSWWNYTTLLEHFLNGTDRPAAPPPQPPRGHPPAKFPHNLFFSPAPPKKKKKKKKREISVRPPPRVLGAGRRCFPARRDRLSPPHPPPAEPSSL